MKWKLLKISVIIGALLGILLKVSDFFRVKAFRCGIKEASVCSWSRFILDTIIWAVILAVVVVVIVFAAKYLFDYLFRIVKKPKKKEKKSSKK